jgi:hypothetical protein
VELDSIFFKTLYGWTAALDLNLLSFHDFSTCFLFLARSFFCMLYVHFGCAKNTFQRYFDYLSKIY